MRFFAVFSIAMAMSCTKKVGIPPVKSATAQAPKACVYQSNTVVSYSATVHPILMQNCGECHTMPGAGGINLDTYLFVQPLAQNGMLVQAIIHDTTYVIMPPPPQKQLDSCQIKAIKLWVNQGCLNN